MNYFWFSSGQREATKKIGDTPMYVKTDSGIKEYTEWSLSDKPDGLWNDYTLVHSSENPPKIFTDEEMQEIDKKIDGALKRFAVYNQGLHDARYNSDPYYRQACDIMER